MFSSLLQKPFGTVAVLGTAVGAPYALFETEVGSAVRASAQGFFQSSSADPAIAAPTGGAVPTGIAPLPHGALLPQSPLPQSPAAAALPEPTQAVPGPTPVWTSAPVYDLREVIRFDMNPMALAQRFPQVVTLAGHSATDIYRVALVTGSAATDLAGTLTYSFDANKAVQRIQFMGTTGDPAMIVGMMVQFYGLRPEPSLGGQLFTTRWNNRVTSLLQVRPASVMSANHPNGNYQLFLELNQPSTYYGLSDEAYQAAGIPREPSRSSWFVF